MSDRMKEVGLLVGIAVRADPKRCVGALLEPLGALAVPLYGVLLGTLATGIINHDKHHIALGAVGLLAMVGLLYLAEWIGTNMRIRLAEEVGFSFDQEIAELIANLPGSGHHENPDYQDRLELLRQGHGALGQSLSQLATTASTVIGALATAAVLAWLNPFILLIVVFVVPSFLTVSMQQRWEKDAERRSAEPARLARHLRGLSSNAQAGKELRVFGLQAHILTRMDDAWTRARQPLHSAFIKDATIAAARAVVFAIGFVLAVGLVLWRASTGRAQPGDVVTAVIVCQQVQRQVLGPAYSLAGLGRLLRNAGRVLWLRDYARQMATSNDGDEPAPERIAVSVVFDRVSFRYPGYDRWVLRDFSVELPAGSVVALVGENGAGKSTIVKLLAGFYAPTQGRILIDGVDLCTLNLVAWREKLSAAFQDFVRPEFTIRRAIGLGDLDHLDDISSVETAARRGGASDIIASSASGLEEQLGTTWPNGVDLSGGQWQKLALSRAFMRNDPLMFFLDEPTASLDAQTEHHLFQESTHQARRMADVNGAVTILVTHRFSTVNSADLILVLKHGRLAQTGAHRELVEAAGLYRELYELQAGAYR